MFRNAWVKVDLDAFQYNIKTISAKSKKSLIAVVKANSYGCGVKVLYKSALDAGVRMFAVSSLEEALKLKSDGCDSDILILGYVDSKYSGLIKENDFILTALSSDWVDSLDSSFKGIRVHIKVDTGMNRLGFKSLEDLQKAMTRLEALSLRIEGIYTHFACSDVDDDFTTKQYEDFKTMVKSLKYNFKWIHAANSDASMRIQDDFCNAVRVGISLYGINTHDKSLKNVISLFAKIVNIKTIHRGESVSYGATYTAEKDEIIATIPLGYADGWIRKNQGRNVYIPDNTATIVGRICMDQLMIKLEKFEEVGRIVEFFGDNIPIEKVSKELDTIPYEVITLLSDRLTRVYYKDGKYLQNINPRLNGSEF